MWRTSTPGSRRCAVARRRDYDGISGFIGEDGSKGLTHPAYRKGLARQLRNYELLDAGRTLKRAGDKTLDATAGNPNTTNPIQGLHMHRSSTANQLLIVSGGNVYRYNQAASTYTDITNGVTLASGANNQTRSDRYIDATEEVTVILDPETNSPVLYDGTNCRILGGTPPANARDCLAFKEHFFFINTDAGANQVEYNSPGDIDVWPAGNNFPADRNSPGMALAAMTEDVALILHRDSIHRMLFNYRLLGTTSSFFDVYPTDSDNGTTATGSVIVFNGVCYFANDEGIWAIDDPTKKATRISRPIDPFWSLLNPTRIQYMQAIPRPGVPWSEIVWLVSTEGQVSSDSAAHDAAISYKPELGGHGGGWTIWTQDVADKFQFNCGTDFIDTDGRHHTVVGTYDGKLRRAWGWPFIPAYNTGYVDGGDTAIEDVILTGFISHNRPQIKSIRELFLELELFSPVTFQLEVEGIDATPLATQSLEFGASGGVLSESFQVGDEASLTGADSYLSSALGSLERATFDVDADATKFQYRLSSTNTDVPHIFAGFGFTFKTKGMRLRA